MSALAYLFRPHAARSAYPSCWFHPALPAADSPLLHEIKHDGYRLITRRGNDWTTCNRTSEFLKSRRTLCGTGKRTAIGPLHIPSIMNLRDFVDLSEIALTSFCAGVASKAFAFSMLSNAIITNRLGASP